MRRRGWTRLLVVLAAMSLLATACPDDNDVDVPLVDDDPDLVDDELRLGYILPETGALAAVGPGIIRAFEMAVDEINEAGGPLGLPVEVFPGDEGDDEAVATATAERLLADGVHGIVGAAASGMSLAIIDQIVGAQRVQCSPSNTSPTFTDFPDDGFYFRTAPSDALQGPVLAEVVLEDGHERVALIGRADDYGRALITATEDALVEAGAEVLFSDVFDPELRAFDAEASAIAAEDPDAVVIVPFIDDGVPLLRDLLEAGITVDQIYGADGIRDEALNDEVDPANPNVLDGFKGTAPDPGAVPGFLDRLREFDPDLGTFVFAPQAYDCGMLIALAVVAAGTVDPTVFKDEIVDLTRGDNDCEGFAECAEFLEAGETINYQFVSGTIEFTDVGEPLNGSYEVWEWADAELTSIDSREVMLEE